MLAFLFYEECGIKTDYYYISYLNYLYYTIIYDIFG